MRRRFALLFALLAASATQAATYKWIDANGRVNYGDRPPSADARPMSSAGGQAADAAPAAPGDASLPYALRAPAARYPVTLFVTRDCEPCEAARAHLAGRGIPFAERSVRTDRDAAGMRAMGFAEVSVPSISVGRETANGFDADAWNRLLDAAGYPRRSILPAGWRPQAPAPEPSTSATGGAAPPGGASASGITLEQINDPANQRDDMREGLVSPTTRQVPIIRAPSPAPPRPSIRF